ncbi:Bug family tripartite tricarboxylate transporter substrate binding protein [Falsiroseomonas sp. CW058]|uniref:Bug family tripartite tricarboxylate transporter substrate binding protein n=1 Tax=Falsiroseomonas sp. CW058 TaxID=3388664 RepID=UPI003D30F90C
MTSSGWPRRGVLGLGAAALAAGGARAQGWQPARPVRLVTPYGPGNVADQVARLVAEELSRRWGQRVVVDNQPGAGGALGVAQIARAPADGTVLGFIAVAALAIIPHMMRARTYEPLEDIVPIAGASVSRSAIVVHPALPVRSVTELVAHARARPAGDPLAYYSAGNGTVPHLAVEQMRRVLDFPAQHVPYRTSGAGVADLLAGRVQLTMDAASVTLPHVQGGALRALAWNGPVRNPSIPDVPTLAEAAPGLELLNAWQGLYGPRGLPAEIVARCAQDMAEVVGDPAFAARMPGGAEPLRAGPEELRATLRRQHAELGRLVAAIGLEQD